jgi:hypothetical protein
MGIGFLRHIFRLLARQTTDTHFNAHTETIPVAENQVNPDFS